MDTITLTLHPDNSSSTQPALSDVSLSMQSSASSLLSALSTGSHVVYNDRKYTFSLSSANVTLPSLIYINDDQYETQLLSTGSDTVFFRLKDCERPFLTCFGAVRIDLSYNGQDYHSEYVTVMVANQGINQSVLNMVDYIYAHGEKYLYDEHEHSMVPSGTKPSEIVSLEVKIAFLKKVSQVYAEVYPALKTRPYSKLCKAETVNTFHKLTSVSFNTVRYIATHADELIPANYDTGIRFNGRYYQPRRVLIEQNATTYDVYENRIVVGFLKTVTEDIAHILRQLQQYLATRSRQSATIPGYINSLVHLFSTNSKRISGYVAQLQELQQQFQQRYFFYSQLLMISPEAVRQLPQFTSVFRSTNAYRQLYEIIAQWFSIGDYDLTKDDFLLSFIATDKIYEYYCLVKMLHVLGQQMTLRQAFHFSYTPPSYNYPSTLYHNTFIFEKDDVRLTLYFQPVIYGGRPAENQIGLFRNTSSTVRSEEARSGYFYTPDYLLKAESLSGGQTHYLLLDAKFSTSQNIRRYQLQELVYKYLFSISPLTPDAQVDGMYILCGKSDQSDRPDVIHDLVPYQRRPVPHFGEILVIGGLNTQDDSMVQHILRQII